MTNWRWWICSLLFVAVSLVMCTKPVSEEQKVVDAFNANSYDFSLSYADGQYQLIPRAKIRANDIKAALEGKRWRVREVGPIRLTGFAEDDSFGSDGSTTVSFTGEVAQLVTTTIPFNEVSTKEEGVSYEDNTVIVGETKMRVCSIQENKVLYFVETNHDNYWLYRCLELLHK